ncbi:MAG: PD-(D/E)XK nuclease family protein [Lachnospiraceae bacterium]|nr:PD-(D/E)XK nuclease family protein [Lachnospiraceae bacterium]
MENKHSIFLSWLLNPLASHGFEEKFAQRFFDKAFEDKDHIPDAGKIERIILEQRINGEKQREDGIDRRRIDILIIGEDFTCTIENKYGSEAHGGQCEDYRNYVEGEYGERKANNRFIFLDIDKPKDFDYMHKSRYAEFDFISYETIRDILGDIISTEKERKTDNKLTISLITRKDMIKRNDRKGKKCN